MVKYTEIDTASTSFNTLSVDDMRYLFFESLFGYYQMYVGVILLFIGFVALSLWQYFIKKSSNISTEAGMKNL